MGVLSNIKATSSSVSTTPEISEPIANGSSDCMPRPCAKCGCPLFWWDAYGGGPHCADCRRSPSASLVARKRMIILDDAGGFIWDDSDDIDSGDEFDEWTVDSGKRILQRVGFKFSDPFHGRWQ